MLAVIKEESNPMWIMCDNESTVEKTNMSEGNQRKHLPSAV
jgi:hypothetical protein